MTTYAHHRAVFAAYLDVLDVAATLPDAPAAMNALAQLAGTTLAAQEGALGRELLAAAAFTAVAGDAPSTRFRHALRRALSPARPELGECLDAFRRAPFGVHRYDVYLASGDHEARAPGGAGEWSRAFASLREGIVCEADADYCCERCDGPRVATPQEVALCGDYVGWGVRAEGASPPFFLALARVEPWVVTRAFVLDADDALAHTRALSAVFAPWSL